MKDKIIKNIPNMFTLFRILTTVIGLLTFILGNVGAAVLFYALGAVSDGLDGWAARKLNAESEFGRKLDAISDKFFVLSLTLSSLLSGNLLMLIPLVLEGEIAAINIASEKMHQEPHTARIGKFKTASLFVTLLIGLIASKTSSFYLLFAPLLVNSTILQVKTIKTYEKVMLDKALGTYEEADKNIVNDENKKDECLSLKDKLIGLKNELLYYSSLNDIPVKEKRKELKK